MIRIVTCILYFLVLHSAAAEVFIYDFEVEEGYEMNPLNGQNAWQVFAGIPDQPTVDDVSPASGSQHLRFSKDTKAQPGEPSGAFSPSLGAQPTDRSPSVSVDLFFSDLGGAAYDVLAQLGSQTQITWRVRFADDGELLIYDSPGGMNGFVGTGVQYPVGGYFKLYVETKTQENEINYYINDELVYVSVAGAAFAQAIGQVVIISNNQHATEDEFLLVDHLIIDTENVDYIFTDPFEPTK